MKKVRFELPEIKKPESTYFPTKPKGVVGGNTESTKADNQVAPFSSLFLNLFWFGNLLLQSRLETFSFCLYSSFRTDFKVRGDQGIFSGKNDEAFQYQIRKAVKEKQNSSA